MMFSILWAAVALSVVVIVVLHLHHRSRSLALQRKVKVLESDVWLYRETIRRVLKFSSKMDLASRTMLADIVRSSDEIRRSRS